MRIRDWSSDVCSSDLMLQRFKTDDQIEAVVGKGIQCTDIGACKAQHRLRAIAAARMRYRAISNIHSEHRMRAGTGQQRTAEARSEEHTSELQSLMRISYAVFCLKKKTNKSNNETH